MSKLRVVQMAIGPMMNFSYLICDEAASVCAAIDPGWEAEKFSDAAQSLGAKIDKVLLTHTHFDHSNALSKLAGPSNLPVFVHREEQGALPQGVLGKPTEEGTVIPLGELQVRCLHTPGHTPGSQCFLVEGAIFTGDTLFVEGCGRVDLPGSDPQKMLHSLKRLAALDPATVVYPGHDYGSAPTSTIGDELRCNPCLSAKSEEMLL